MEFSNTGGMRSPFSPRVRQSIAGRKSIGMSARQNQGKFMQSNGSQTGDVIFKTPMSTYETYGSPLPVMVTETLTFATGEVSVRISPCGWCWLVSGRRVVAWPREPLAPGVCSPAASPPPAAARELTLPQTDLAHKADLVELFYEDGAQMPSCVGVSPEGVVRYWWSVGHESASVDVSCELAGQEAARLLAAGDRLLLATTTCSVLVLQPRRHEGRATVTCRVLRPPSGWLGGIGRRVSLLFFGAMPAHADTKLVGLVVLEEGPLEGEPGEGAGLLALVGGSSAGPWLQLWAGGAPTELALRAPLAAAYRHGDLSSVELTALDVRASGPRSLLLLLAVGDPRDAELTYAVAHMSVEAGPAAAAASASVRSLAAVRWAGPGEQPPRLLPLPPRPHALLYSHAYLVCAPVTAASEQVDLVDVTCEGDSILAAEQCGAVPLVFSRRHGLLALRGPAPGPARSLCDSPMDSPCPSDMYDGNLSLYEIDPHEVSAVTTDAVGKLKAAFLFHVRRDVAACRGVLERLFPDARDHALDNTVLAVAQDIVDDVPAGDPRWKLGAGGLRTRVPLGSSTALLPAHQLADKHRALTLYRAFLAATLTPRTRHVTQGGASVSTVSAVGALAGCVGVARSLRRAHDGAHAALVAAAVLEVVSGAEGGAEEPEVVEALAAGALTAADVFYRRVSRVRRALPALARATPAPRQPHAPAALLTQLLAADYKYSAEWAGEEAGTGASDAAILQMLPSLGQAVRRTLTAGRECGSAAGRWQAEDAAAALADQLLARQPPPRERRELMQPFVDEGLVERAAVLAEKFRDYELLAELCLDAEDMDRLYGYIDKYCDEGMAEVSFARVVERGGAGVGRLLRGARGAAAARLDAWLQTPPRAHLLALRRLAAPTPAAAAAPLAELAAQEARSLQRMTTMASLAKLCLLTSDENDSESCELRRKVESCLSLADQHLSLPRDIRVHNGLDAEDTKVYSPDEIVQMYIWSESPSLTEYDLKKALDLTELVEDMERRDELRLRVWCASVRRDAWGAGGDAAADQLLRDKMFFRLASLVHLMGGDLELVLPAIEDVLTARELADLGSDAHFHYLLKLGYQCLRDTCH